MSKVQVFAKRGAALVYPAAVSLTPKLALAQIPAGGMAPGAMATAIATAFLAAGAAVAVAAGSFKAYQVWSGGRNPYEAVKYMMIGCALLFGTAAVVGFAG